jgi:hypothetical protein
MYGYLLSTLQVAKLYQKVQNLRSFPYVAHVLLHIFRAKMAGLVVITNANKPGISDVLGRTGYFFF